MWVGPGTNRTCDGCDQPIIKPELEYEIDLPGDRVCRFHQKCLDLWHQERGRAKATTYDDRERVARALVEAGGFICEGCLALKAGLSPDEVAAAIERLQQHLQIAAMLRGRCRQCGGFARIFKIA